MVEDLVNNLSDETFDQDKMELLNSGLNFSIKPGKVPVRDIITGIESSIQYRLFEVRMSLREKAISLFKFLQKP